MSHGQLVRNENRAAGASLFPGDALLIKAQLAIAFTQYPTNRESAHLCT